MIMSQGKGIACEPLATATDRSQYLVHRVTGPERRRLCEMGLVEGAKVDVINRARPGMMIVKVGGSRLALARGMADYVMVR